jgi:glycerol transport system ATP-binding protein
LLLKVNDASATKSGGGSTAAVLKLQGIRLAEGAVPLDHEFQSGRITVVLGRNRSGKTRLCRVLAGLEPTGGGRIVLDGMDISTTSPRQRPISLVYQSFVNYPTLTVAENIASPMRARGVPAPERGRRVEALAARLHIAELLDRRPAQLSGGQQQRLAIARALAKEARVVVLDEPLVNLDFKLREALELELRGLLQDAGIVVVYTSSDPRDAFNLGDEVLLLADHESVQAGRPLDVYQRPVSVAAADLMSDPGVNLLPGPDGQTAIRPEHLHVSPHGPGDETFAAELLTLETNGSETYLHCRVADAHWVVKLEGLLDRTLQPGDALPLYAEQRSLLRFAEASTHVQG